MSEAFNVTITQDTATAAIDTVTRALSLSRVQRAVGTACVLLTQRRLDAMPPNKRGWPSSGFYRGASKGTDWSATSDGISINIDNAKYPGAMRQRYHGGTINMKDHMLTIPARQEFYGQKATDFTNLRLVVFKSGAMALVIGKGGTDRVDFATGNEKRVKGAGVRSQAMVAYWLKRSVDQDADPSVVPTPQEYVETGKGAVLIMFDNAMRGEVANN